MNYNELIRAVENYCKIMGVDFKLGTTNVNPVCFDFEINGAYLGHRYVNMYMDDFERVYRDIKAIIKVHLAGRNNRTSPFDDCRRRCKPVYVNPMTIKNVIYNGPATIVFWEDGTKTVVKCYDEAYDKEKGLAMAICKKALGNKGNYCNTLKKWL